jgi:hypothetical protein
MLRKAPRGATKTHIITQNTGICISFLRAAASMFWRALVGLESRFSHRSKVKNVGGNPAQKLKNVGFSSF